MRGYLDYSRMICSLCLSPYEIPEVRLEPYFTENYGVDLIFYNSMGVSILMNYMSILFGVYTGESIAQRLAFSQKLIYLLYSGLYGAYIRLQNPGLYTAIALQRRSYIYLAIQLYMCYMSLQERYAIFSLTSMMMHRQLWKEHVQLLQAVNQRLIEK
jgi:hypothetical protein